MTNEFALAAATALSREVGGADFAPRAVSFMHEAPADLAVAKEFFRCPVRFSADRNGIEINTQELRTPNTLGDLKISEFFDRHLEVELAGREQEASIDYQVIRLIRPALSEGPPRLEDIARRLAMSARTLQRRLAGENLAFVDLVDRARQDLATHLLREKQYELAEIAFLCGYADQSTFSRAFRRWKGQTPAEFRRG